MSKTIEKCFPEELQLALKTNIKIVKSVLSRCLYALYLVFAVWRVVLSWGNKDLWLLLIFLVPLSIEAVCLALKRKGSEFKWVSPGVMIYLMGSIPCIWLWEVKLHEIRVKDLQPSNGTSCDSLLGVCLGQEAWTLAMEQTIILILIVGKWIAPKGQMSQDEISQLLLVYLGSGCDIMGILDLTRDENIQKATSSPIPIFVILAVWSWSLLQFGFMLSATRDIPNLQSAAEPENIKVEEATEETNEDEKITPKENVTDDEFANEKQLPTNSPSACSLPCCYGNHMFCFYNEMWSLAISLIFQDIPFLILRLAVMILYGAVSNTTIFFSFKNFLVVILLLNRIRSVVTGQKHKWFKIMEEAKHQKLQSQSGIPMRQAVEQTQVASSHEIKKPKWLIWRV